MACKGSGVQIPSAPLTIMKKFLNETKELLLSQGLIAVLAIIQVRVVATNLGPEAYGNIGVYLGLVGLSFRILSSRNSDLVLINFKSTNKIKSIRKKMIKIKDSIIGEGVGGVALQIHDGGGIKVKWKNLKIQKL